MLRWVKGIVLAGLLALCFGSDARAVRRCIPESECYKICDAGKACGKTCISARATCHKRKNYACNRSEVCPDQASASSLTD